MSYFKGKFVVREGGVASGFKHVKKAEYPSRLLLVKGQPTPRIIPVELSASSLNGGDAFVLDHGLIIIDLNVFAQFIRKTQLGSQFIENGVIGQ